MHDMRKKALTESLKTTSRKARNRPESLGSSAKTTPKGGSVNGSRQASRHASAANSRAGSRYPSEDEGGSELSSAVSKLRLAGPTAGASPRLSSIRYRRGRDGDDDDEVSDSDSDADSYGSLDDAGSEELADNAPLWRTNFQKVLATLQDRKRANIQERSKALSKYGRLLQTIYNGEAVADALPTILEQLLKSVRRGASGEGEEKQLALDDLSITSLSCLDDTDAATVFDDAFSTLKRAVQDPDADESDKAAAIQTLGVVVLVGCGIQKTINELLNFLLEIVETDGDSVAALDSAPVVTAALRMWTFGASFVIDSIDEIYDEDNDQSDDGHDADVEDDADGGDGDGARSSSHDSEMKSSEEDGDGDGGLDLEGQDYFVSESQRALEAFVDQLESTEVDVQINAGVAIALLYEASRKYEEAQGRPLQLQRNPAELAELMLELGQGSSRSIKSVNRQVRRQLRENFRDIATSLEHSAGPGFATAGLPKNKTDNPGTTGKYVYDSDDEAGTMAGGPDLDRDTGAIQAFGHQKRLVIGDRSMSIDTWGKSVRVDMLRKVLGSGLSVHLVKNPRVRLIVEAKRLQRLKSATSRDEKKGARKKNGGKMEKREWHRKNKK